MMANEKRLIDADALMKKADWFSYEDDWGEVDEFQYIDPEDVENAPTVDAVEVVRCAKCEFYDEEGEFCKFWHGVRHPEHYCGEGERRTDNEDNS